MTKKVELSLDAAEGGAVSREIRGLGPVRVEVLSLGISAELAEEYFGQPMRVDYRRFVSEVVARMVSSPELTAAEADRLSESVRASLRLAIAEAAGVRLTYRRLTGTMLSGDERLFAVLLEEHRLLQQLMVEWGKRLSASIPKWVNSVFPSIGRQMAERQAELMRAGPPAARRGRSPELVSRPRWLRDTTSGSRFPGSATPSSSTRPSGRSPLRTIATSVRCRRCSPRRP